MSQAPRTQPKVAALVGAATLFALAAVGYSIFPRPAAEGVPDAARHVVYEVFGDGDVADITYTDDGGTHTAQEQNAPMPFRKEFRLEEAAFQVFTLSAQNAEEGPITCRITVDGEVIDETTSVGAWELALCSDSSM
ncbi:MmpS family transport accessory protein [Saccharopolyspora taberi]|uniref:MmpS family membrane protein n=1 Tax=Saccharopolyspora taberi TaxID=60895 RepID=A0ABN3V7X1_9PSEU